MVKQCVNIAVQWGKQTEKGYFFENQKRREQWTARVEHPLYYIVFEILIIMTDKYGLLYNSYAEC